MDDLNNLMLRALAVLLAEKGLIQNDEYQKHFLMQVEKSDLTEEKKEAYRCLSGSVATGGSC